MEVTFWKRIWQWLLKLKMHVPSEQVATLRALLHVREGQVQTGTWSPLPAHCGVARSSEKWSTKDCSWKILLLWLKSKLLFINYLNTQPLTRRSL